MKHVNLFRWAHQEFGTEYVEEMRKGMNMELQFELQGCRPAGLLSRTRGGKALFPSVSDLSDRQGPQLRAQTF